MISVATPFDEYFGLLALQVDVAAPAAATTPGALPRISGEATKAELRMRGSSCAAIAKQLDVTRSTVHLVVFRRARSARVEAAIADALRQPKRTK